MSLSKSYIESRFNSAKNKKNNNDNNCAQSHESSLVYKQDITNNEGKFNNIVSEITAFKTAISGVISKASSNTTNFTNTISNLSSLNNNVSSSEVDSIKEMIKEKSLEAYNELKKQYDNNYSSFDKTISYIENLLNSYDTLEKRLKVIESSMISINLSKDENKAIQLSNLYSEKNKVTRQMQSVLESCLSNIEVLDNSNNLNVKILDQGLKKA